MAMQPVLQALHGCLSKVGVLDRGCICRIGIVSDQRQGVDRFQRKGCDK